MIFLRAPRNSPGVGKVAEDITPSPPASLAAAANSVPLIHCIHPPMTGCSIPSISVRRVLSMMLPPL